jgi:hypothetical protein
MAITRTAKTPYDNTASSATYSTTPTTYTPVADSIWVVGIVSGTSQVVNSVGGCNLTWTSRGSQTFNSTNHRLSVFTGTGPSPTTEAITVTLAGSASGISFIVDEIDDTVNGVEFVRASTPVEFTAVTGGNIPMSAFDDPTDGFCYAVFAIDNDAAISIGGGSGLTKGSEQQGLAPDRTVAAMYMIGQNLAPAATWPTSLDGGGIGLEFKPSAPPPPEGGLVLLDRSLTGGMQQLTGGISG